MAKRIELLISLLPDNLIPTHIWGLLKHALHPSYLVFRWDYEKEFSPCSRFHMTQQFDHLILSF